MRVNLLANLIACVCAFAGFIYGSVLFFKPKKAIFPQMVTLAVGCLAFGKLYQVVRLLTGGDVFGEFQLGVFGVIGSLIFLFSANFGAMDSLADDKQKKYRKYRLLALLAPAAALTILLLFIFGTELPLFAAIGSGVITFFVMPAAYYHLKHLIFPDVERGIVNCLKPYNLFALIYCFLCMAEMVVIGLDSGLLVLIANALMGLSLICIVIATERGIKKWTT